MISRTTEVIDFETGTKTQDVKEWNISQAVLFPKLMEKKFFYDLSFIAANKNFTYGGIVPMGTRFFLVDPTDAPDYVPTINDSIQANGNYYTLKTFSDYSGEAFYIAATEVEGDQS